MSSILEALRKLEIENNDATMPDQNRAGQFQKALRPRHFRVYSPLLFGCLLSMTILGGMIVILLPGRPPVNHNKIDKKTIAIKVLPKPKNTVVPIKPKILVDIKDPLDEEKPPDKIPSRVELDIQALVYSKHSADSFAVINERIVKIGDNLDGIKIIAIEENHILFEEKQFKWKQELRIGH